MVSLARSDNSVVIERSAFGRGSIKLLLQLHRKVIFDGIENRYVFAHGLIGRIAVNARGSRIPGGHTSLDIQ